MKTSVALAVVLAAALCGQSNDVRPGEAKGLPPRATPADYQTHVQAGAVTIAAEFAGHAVTTAEATLNTEDYVTVEVGFFGQPNARLRLAIGDFSLRINGRKQLYPAQPYAAIFHSLKDPTWAPPVSESKSKTSLGGSSASSEPPPVVHMPFGLERAMQQNVQRAALPEGDRALPAAGLIFFQYGGKEKGIHTVELIYTGPAGNATVALQ